METDSNLKSAIRKVASAANLGTLASLSVEETRALRSAIGDPDGESSEIFCSRCRCGLDNLSVVGHLLANELNELVANIREGAQVVVRAVEKGAPSVVEFPPGKATYKTLSPQGPHVWSSYLKKNSEVVYPEETGRMSCLLIEDKDFSTGLVPMFCARVNTLFTEVSEKEKALWAGKRVPAALDKVRVVTIRKPYEAKAIDTYTRGRAARGWTFETVIGAIEFSE